MPLAIAKNIGPITLGVGQTPENHPKRLGADMFQPVRLPRWWNYPGSLKLEFTTYWAGETYFDQVTVEK